MQLKIFSIPVSGTSPLIDELNKFPSTHWIVFFPEFLSSRFKDLSLSRRLVLRHRHKCSSNNNAQNCRCANRNNNNPSNTNNNVGFRVCLQPDGIDGCLPPAREKSRPLHIKGRRPKKRGKAGSWDGFPRRTSCRAV